MTHEVNWTSIKDSPPPVGEPLYAAYTVAIDAMEKQIPKKPKEYEDSCYLYPVCGNAVLYKGDRNDGIPYCLGCGQALDWREMIEEL